MIEIEFQKFDIVLELRSIAEFADLTYILSKKVNIHSLFEDLTCEIGGFLSKAKFIICHGYPSRR
ncbi:hypothetical protein NARC_40155 [Candidatus Nitrosocosmicus arcticus]|uniref:Uncharacterized protein n=1 Tax=Candidatus Nitrosocosmicus arcticus TaxID=2035267 RepID=A0A557SX66_9ARCH|nr:hypothetical protein NARC_40155 [Candidatus Nitrosocosmicus arcticus]